MLSEVRARAVDVESGVTPAAVGALPLNDASSAEIAAAEAVRVTAIAPPECRKPARVKTATPRGRSSRREHDPEGSSPWGSFLRRCPFGL